MYNIWNKWDPLEVCMLGNNYAPEFFNGIPDQAGDPLKRICEETLEDLDGYKKVLQDFGVEVIQPELDPRERFLDNTTKPRGPLQPRDFQLVLGNTCFTTEQDHVSIANKLIEYDPENTICIDKDQFPISSATAFYFDNCLLIGETRVSKDVSFLLENDYNSIKKIIKTHTDLDINIQLSPMEGHTDANFHTLKPGVILSLFDVQNYNKTFPGWDICYLPDQSWEMVADFLSLKRKNKGKWYLAGEANNDEFINFVETWLQEWVGYVEETVFDVNVLMLDESHCCVSNPNNQQVNTFLKKHNIEPVYVPFRHRYFWDGGLHCITLDLKRRNIKKEAQ